MKVWEFPRVLLAIGRVMVDSTRTSEIHAVEEITGRASYRRYLRSMADHPGLVELLAHRPELCSEQVDYEALRALPPRTLGAAYSRHLVDNDLSADYQAADTRWVDEPDVAYLLRRFRQTHDVWHTLLGLGVEGHEEVLVHAFSWGQMRLPVSALVVGFGTLKHFVGERRWEALREDIPEAYRIGRGAEPLLPVYWERMWEQPIDEVRAQFGVRPLSE